MQLQFNPTGTHVQKGLLKVRLNLFPEESDLTYQSQHVYVPIIPEGGYPGARGIMGRPLDMIDYQAWLDSLPHIWRVNPCLCHFVSIDEGTKLPQLKNFVEQTFDKNLLAKLDNTLVLPDSAHRLHFMKDKFLSKNKVRTKDFPDLLNSINEEFRDYGVILNSKGKFDIPPSESIDIGGGATNRATTYGGAYTYVELTNPANDSGTLDTIELWFNINGGGVKAGTFSGSGTSYDDRDYETIGSVTSGSKQTFSGLSIDVVAGDFIGDYWSSGEQEGDTSGGSGLYYASGDKFGTGSNTYALLADFVGSIYATSVDIVQKSLAGALSFSGALTEHHRRFVSLSGALTPSGVLGTLFRFSKALAGSLSMSGTLGRKVGKGLSGALTMAAVLGRKIGKGLSGSLTPSGVVNIVFRRFVSLTGSISFSGILTSHFRRFAALSGSLSMAGIVGRKIRKGLSGSITSSGTLTTIYRRLVTISGSLIMSGVVGRKIRKALAGSISFSGSLNRKIRKALSGILSFIGILTGRRLRYLTVTVYLPDREITVNFHSREQTVKLGGQ